MNKYEAMLIVGPEPAGDDKGSYYKQFNDLFSKNGATIVSSVVWSEKRRLSYPIKKQREGVYYLVTFESVPESVSKIRGALSLNDSVLRTLILEVHP